MILMKPLPSFFCPETKLTLSAKFFKLAAEVFNQSFILLIPAYFFEERIVQLGFLI